MRLIGKDNTIKVQDDAPIPQLGGRHTVVAHYSEDAKKPLSPLRDAGI